MTAEALAKIAADLIPPTGTTGACAVVETTNPTTYRAAFVVDGRRKVPTGPRFEKARDAYALVGLLGGKP